MSNAVSTYSKYRDDLKVALDAFPMDQLNAATEMLENAFHSGKTVFVAGNGGSAATASHFSCDFNKTTLGKSEPLPKRRLKCIALSDNMPLITAWGNDTSYDVVFSEQLRNWASADDVLIVITCSGNSPNIVKSLEAAKELGVKTIGLLGFGGGKCLSLADVPIVIDSYDYGVVEDSHSIVMHMLTAHLRALVLG